MRVSEISSFDSGCSFKAASFSAGGRVGSLVLPVARAGRGAELHLLSQSLDGVDFSPASSAAGGLVVTLGCCCLLNRVTFGLTEWGGGSNEPDELDLSARGLLTEGEARGD